MHRLLPLPRSLYLLVLFAGAFERLRLVHSLTLQNPVSASEYVEIVPGSPAKITWTSDAGDPTSFKIKLRNRGITQNNGQWVLVANVSTASGSAVFPFLDVPASPNYYVEADIYQGTQLSIAYSGVNQPFTVVDAASAHLASSSGQAVPPSTTNQATSPTVTEKLTTQVLASTVTLPSAVSIISYTITTQTAVPLTTYSSPAPTGTSAGASTSTGHSNLAPVLGGVLGGVCVLLLIVFVLLKRRRQNQRSTRKTSGEPDDPVPFTGYKVDSDNNADGNLKGQLQRVLEERDASQVQYDSLQASHGSTLRPDSSGYNMSDSRSTERVLRQHIQTMNERIMHLETQMNSNHGGPSIAGPDVPPPNYVFEA